MSCETGDCGCGCGELVQLGPKKSPPVVKETKVCGDGSCGCGCGSQVISTTGFEPRGRPKGRATASPLWKPHR